MFRGGRLWPWALVAAITKATTAYGWYAPRPVRSHAGAVSVERLVDRGDIQKAKIPDVLEHNIPAPLVPNWVRGLLAAAAIVAVVTFGQPKAAHAAGSVQMYFGQGCFWHVQHEFVKQEVLDLARPLSDVTALSGYAGGNKVGDKGNVCYHNMAFAPDYGKLGHTEVVNLTIPEEKVGTFAKKYFDEADGYRLGRADPQDRGSEYRSAIGLPGGMDGPLFKEVEAANAGRMQLLRGQGNDADTVGTKKVWIYDSNRFPFMQGEIYHQFHDDMMERYSEKYHSVKNMLLEKGTIKKVDCPEMGF